MNDKYDCNHENVEFDPDGASCNDCGDYFPNDIVEQWFEDND